MKMTLTFEWIDEGRGKDGIVAEGDFLVKGEADVKKDVKAWVDAMFAADRGAHKHFEVCRRYGCKGDRCWIVYGKRRRFNWSVNFMSWADVVMGCTMNYLGWERDIMVDSIVGKGYTFVSSEGEVRKFKKLTEVDKFIREEMRRQSGRQEKE